MKLADHREYPPLSQNITLIDQKENFTSSPSCKFINPSKSELGKASKMIIKKINKRLCKFECMDIKDFCLSTIQTMLNNTLLFVKEHMQVSEDDSLLIKLCKKSLHFSKGDTWKKNSSNSTFDVTIWNYDVMFELSGLCILSHLTTFIEQKDIELCRDDPEVAKCTAASI